MNEDSNKGLQFGSKKSIWLNPIVWKILIIAIIVFFAFAITLAIIGAIVGAFMHDTYDKDKGTLSALHGVNGDNFYGVRLIYKDEEKSSLEMEDYYLTFTNSILLQLKESGVDIVDIIADYKNDTTVQTVTTNYAVA